MKKGYIRKKHESMCSSNVVSTKKNNMGLGGYMLIVVLLIIFIDT
jgi:hypothetical protein